MLNEKETLWVLKRFFDDCFQYWNRNGYGERESFERALKDVIRIKHDPFTPFGELLDEETQTKFIQYRQMDLGGNHG